MKWNRKEARKISGEIWVGKKGEEKMWKKEGNTSSKKRKDGKAGKEEGNKSRKEKKIWKEGNTSSKRIWKIWERKEKYSKMKK